MTEFPPDVLFCCDEYKRHLYAALTHPATIGYYGDTKIDTAPHPPYGSKHARKVAKERAAQRLQAVTAITYLIHEILFSYDNMM